MITLAATKDYLAFSFAGPYELAHRHAQLCDAGESDGLLLATTKALEVLHPVRADKLLMKHRKHAAALLAMDAASILMESQPPLIKPELLLVEIRTSSQEVIDAGSILQSLTLEEVPQGLPQARWVQLRRFVIRWTLLPSDSSEVAALERWAKLFCHPGMAVYRDGLGRADSNAVVKSYEEAEELDGVVSDLKEIEEEYDEAA
jgi:hypothetical protein